MPVNLESLASRDRQYLPRWLDCIRKLHILYRGEKEKIVFPSAPLVTIHNRRMYFVLEYLYLTTKCVIRSDSGWSKCTHAYIIKLFSGNTMARDLKPMKMKVGVLKMAEVLSSCPSSILHY